MFNCKMKKSELVEAIETQLDKHRKEYTEALNNWRKIMRRAAQRVVDGDEALTKVPREFFDCQPPENHEKEFTEALAMLKHTQENIVELDSDTYAQLVEGRFNWHRAWSARNETYRKLSSEG